MYDNTQLGSFCSIGRQTRLGPYRGAAPVLALARCVTQMNIDRFTFVACERREIP